MSCKGQTNISDEQCQSAGGTKVLRLENGGNRAILVSKEIQSQYQNDIAHLSEYKAEAEGLDSMINTLPRGEDLNHAIQRRKDLSGMIVSIEGGLRDAEIHFREQKKIKHKDDSVPRPTSLNRELLYLIEAVQSYQTHMLSMSALNEALGLENQDRYQKTKDFYESLPVEMVGLKKNLYDFESICRFELTDEMYNTVFSELSKFPLNF